MFYDQYFKPDDDLLKVETCCIKRYIYIYILSRVDYLIIEAATAYSKLQTVALVVYNYVPNYPA